MTEPDTQDAPDGGRAGPLSGLKVLDFSRILSGPWATMQLADMGAEVIKIESLDQGDDTHGFPPFVGPLSHYFIALNRSKKSVALNLKTPEGAAVARDLARRADVVVENFRPGVMERLGLGHAALAAENPRLVTCSIAGFGAGSPLEGKPAFDIVAQALSGVMSVNREPGQAPNKLGVPLGDLAGSIFAVQGVLAALHERSRTGRGRHVEVSMLDGLMGMLGYLGQLWFVTGEAPKPVGTRHPSITPYGAYPTADGHVIVACLTEGFWRNFAACLGMPELAEDPRFAAYQDRLANRDALEEISQTRMRAESTEAWLARLDAHDVPNAPILDVGQALEQPHAAARGLVEVVERPETGPLPMVRGPVRFDGAGPAPADPPPLLGEHTAEVLTGELGLDAAALERLARQGAVARG